MLRRGVLLRTASLFLSPYGRGLPAYLPGRLSLMPRRGVCWRLSLLTCFFALQARSAGHPPEGCRSCRDGHLLFAAAKKVSKNAA